MLTFSRHPCRVVHELILKIFLHLFVERVNKMPKALSDEFQVYSRQCSLKIDIVILYNDHLGEFLNQTSVVDNFHRICQILQLSVSEIKT